MTKPLASRKSTSSRPPRPQWANAWVALPHTPWPPDSEQALRRRLDYHHRRCCRAPPSVGRAATTRGELPGNESRRWPCSSTTRSCNPPRRPTASHARTPYGATGDEPSIPGLIPISQVNTTGNKSPSRGPHSRQQAPEAYAGSTQPDAGIRIRENHKTSRIRSTQEPIPSFPGVLPRSPLLTYRAAMVSLCAVGTASGWRIGLSRLWFSGLPC